jgi:hypothetical protein
MRCGLGRDDDAGVERPVLAVACAVRAPLRELMRRIHTVFDLAFTTYRNVPEESTVMVPARPESCDKFEVDDVCDELC